MRTRPTMRDVATWAGVSQTTVSLVLNNTETTNIPDATRAKVFAAIGERAGDHARRLHAEDGAQALASGKDAVAHGLMNCGGILRAGGQQTFERRVGSLLTVEKSFFQHGRLKV